MEMTSSSGGGRYMAYSPSPSALHSPHLSGLRSTSSSAALIAAEKEKYLSELLGKLHKLSPFLPVLPHCNRLLNQVFCICRERELLVAGAPVCHKTLVFFRENDKQWRPVSQDALR
ncbi:hypothetical protein ACFX13_018697 [Malus domestica]